MTGVSLAVYSREPAGRGNTLAGSPEPIGVIGTDVKEATMDNDNNVGGYEIPVDPMDLLQCDSCQ